MSSLPGKKRVYQDHLRYKHMVARLQGLPAHAIETAVLGELAKGKRWRIDAALEALVKDGKNLGMVNMVELCETAGRFGRLTAIHRLVDIFEIKKINRAVEKNRPAAAGMAEAYDLAVINGHYRVADFLRAYGVRPGHMMTGSRAPRAMAVAISTGDLHKLSYLLKCGAHAAGYLEYAVLEAQPVVVAALLDAGANVNEARNGYGTPLNLAAHMGNKPMVDLLLARGARVDACWDTLLFDCVREDIDPVIFDTLVAQGAVPDETVLGRALYMGLPQYVDRILALGDAVKPETLIAAITSPKTSDALVDVCLRRGASVSAALERVKSKDMPRRDEVLARLRQLAETVAAPVTPPKPPSF